jgi:glyceraldehyde 3-phosphate dehydrogenase
MSVRPTHDISPALSQFAKTLRAANAGIVINAAGDIGLSSATLGLQGGLPVVAINEPDKTVDESKLAAALGGRHHGDVTAGDGFINYAGQKVSLLKTFEPWTEKIDHDGPIVVLNCSGVGFDNATSRKFLDSWADMVMLSGPPTDSDIPLAMHGVTADDVLASKAKVISMASCTTNSAARGVIAIDGAFPVNGGTMESAHSATNSNGACDGWRTGPGILDSIAIPGGSGALKLLGRVVPKLEGVFAGGAFRLPCSHGSITTLTLHTSVTDVTAEGVNSVLESSLEAREDYFAYNKPGNAPLTIGDIRDSYYLSWWDGASTKVVNMGEAGSLISVHFGYSNKWGFAFGLLGLAAQWADGLSK